MADMQGAPCRFSGLAGRSRLSEHPEAFYVSRAASICFGFSHRALRLIAVIKAIWVRPDFLISFSLHRARPQRDTIPIRPPNFFGSWHGFLS